jgi:dihydrodipicolinate synthase/N-acetylneuraminate lyase
VRFVKEEVPPALENLASLIQAREPNVWGVFGGHGCLELIEELKLGAAGNMPGAAFADIFARIFDLYESGQTEDAAALHRRVIPLIRKAGPVKESLVRRGVIRSARTRAADGRTLDAAARAERDRIWPDLAAEFTYSMGD